MTSFETTNDFDEVLGGAATLDGAARGLALGHLEFDAPGSVGRGLQGFGGNGDRVLVLVNYCQALGAGGRAECEILRPFDGYGDRVLAILGRDAGWV